jgi:predicted metal-dependent phosphoesterase TrpH
LIDLHTHTNESDGTYTPAELVDAAVRLKLEALAITDHDTFAGYDEALPIARQAALDLVCGIELSCRLAGSRESSIHLLGYFLHEPPSKDFRTWLSEVLADRRDRNVRLIDRLQSMGVDIQLSEVEAVGGTLTGRPHFARVLVQKGYARNSEDAFRKYLSETAPAYVERHSPYAVAGIQNVMRGGGLAVLAHPIRLGIRDPREEEALILELCEAGLGGLEVYHADHRPADIERYERLAKKLDLAITGGSDFHGGAKPGHALGTGVRGNLNIPRDVLDRLRERRPH